MNRLVPGYLGLIDNLWIFRRQCWTDLPNGRYGFTALQLNLMKQVVEVPEDFHLPARNSFNARIGGCQCGAVLPANLRAECSTGKLSTEHGAFQPMMCVWIKRRVPFAQSPNPA